MTITQETIDALYEFKIGLNAAEDACLMNEDRASDLFSYALHEIGQDYDTWCEVCP